MIKAILFDLDGVLVDLVKIHEYAFITALALKALVYIDHDYHDQHLNGLPTKKKLSILEHFGLLKLTTELRYEIGQLKQAMTIFLMKKTLEFDTQKYSMFTLLQENGYRIGCVSNSIRSTIEDALTLTGQRGFMAEIISNEDVKNPKPDPEGYMLAMSKLMVLPRETLIIEDNHNGILAAKKSGAHVLEVSGPHDVTYDNIMLKISEINNANSTVS